MVNEALFDKVENQLKKIKKQIEGGSVKVVKKVDYDTCGGKDDRGPYSACCIIELVTTTTGAIVVTLHLQERYKNPGYSYNNFVEITEEQDQTATLPPQVQKFDFESKTLWVSALIIRITDIVPQWDNVRWQCGQNR